MNKILVTGANGQLGRELRNEASALLAQEKCPCQFFFTDIAGDESTVELSITDLDGLRDFVNKNGITAIVNCAAYTNVDRAEDDFATADLLNNKGVENLATAAKEAGAKLVHISTDYVFGGNGNMPYTEDMPVEPLGVYGVTKLLGEESIKRVMGEGGDYIILRTAWLYSPYGNNFMKTMRRLTSEKERLSVVFDQVGTPTYAADLAHAIMECIDKRVEGGIYHFSNEGVCSWYDFALEIASMSGNSMCKVLPCHSDEFPSKVKRPNYSVLDKTKIKKRLGMEIPHWKDSLARCLARVSE